MDPLRFSIAAAPLGAYLLMMGIINLRRRPFVATGARDAAALGIGIAGLVIVGPMELFFPEGASRTLGFIVWILLIVFYGLCVSLVVLLMRPRIIVYNANSERIRSLLADLALRLDPKSRWIGENLIMPTVNIQLMIQCGTWLNNVQLISIGGRQSLESWRELEKMLRMELKTRQMAPNLIGIGLIVAAVGLAIVSTAWMIARKQEIAQSFVDMLRL